MIRLIATAASVAWLAFMTWGAMRELKANQAERGDDRDLGQVVREQLNDWLRRRKTAARPEE